MHAGMIYMPQARLATIFMRLADRHSELQLLLLLCEPALLLLLCEPALLRRSSSPCMLAVTNTYGRSQHAHHACSFQKPNPALPT